MAASSEAASILSNNPCSSLFTNQLNQQLPAALVVPSPAPAKKKRNLPGTPDPDAEVIALSPRTLLATNRFVCEICGKGFQRDQNLQLHRRGHNLPWKLRQRSGKEPPRKRVYVCPEKTCVHHSPARALGDLTGIKKHFCRKHGEKKWKCDKCSKRYAVQSDWKAHAKTCGTREYRCDCGTLFSRRDSFTTHRAFCDALAEETAKHRLNAAAATTSPHDHQLLAASLPPPVELRPNPNMMLPPPAPAPFRPAHLRPIGSMEAAGSVGGLSLWGGGAGNALPSMGLLPGGVPPQLYADLFSAAPPHPHLDLGWLCGNAKLASSGASELTSASAAPGKDTVPSLFSGQQHAKPAATADMSATALLHKAAQMGAVTSRSGSAMAIMVEALDDHHSSHGGGLLFCAGHGQGQQNAAHLRARGSGTIMSELTAAAGNMQYDVLSAVRHGGLKDAAVAVGKEETRDFLGVGVQALCSSSSSLNGWI